MKVRIMSRLMSAFAALLAFASFAAPEIVSKDIGDPEMNGWTPGIWVTAASAAYSDSWSTDWSAGRLPQPSPGGVWFPSADKSAQSRALGGLVLKGSGKIDDLCVVEEDPFLGMGERALLLLR
jgi:hypothetical protein